jgi:hypothetical protein
MTHGYDILILLPALSLNVKSLGKLLGNIHHIPSVSNSNGRPTCIRCYKYVFTDKYICQRHHIVHYDVV